MENIDLRKSGRFESLGTRCLLIGLSRLRMAALQLVPLVSRAPPASCNGRSCRLCFTSVLRPMAMSGSVGRWGVLSTGAHFEVQECTLGRRHLIGLVLSMLAISGGATPPVFASDTAYEEGKFSLNVPKDWVKGEGNASGSRKVVAFHPLADTSANVYVLITNLAADFTSMGSFGSVDTFATNLVGSMDTSWKNPPGQAAKLIDATSRNGMYYVEYTVQKPGEPRRHLLSAVGIGDDKFYRQLYTVTGQYLEQDADKYRKVLEQAILSFKIR